MLKNMNIKLFKMLMLKLCFFNNVVKGNQFWYF